MDLWRKLSYFLAFPSMVIMSVSVYLHETQHASHERPEFVPYDHLRIRTKVTYNYCVYN